MKNEILVRNNNRISAVTLIICAIVIFVFGSLLVYDASIHKFLGEYCEITATVTDVEYEADEEILIKTEEYECVFRITDLFVGNEEVFNSEKFISEVQPNTVLTLKVLKSQFNENEDFVFVKYLSTSKEVYLSEQTAEKVVLESDRETFIIGIVMIVLGVCAFLAGVVILLYASKSKKVELFRYFGRHTIGPQPIECKKPDTFRACVIIALFAVLIVCLCLTEVTENYLLLGIIALAVTLVSCLLLVCLNRKVDKLRVNFYKELFTFTEDKLKDDACGLFFNQSVGGTEICRVDERGISSIDDAAYFRLYFNGKEEKICVLPTTPAINEEPKERESVTAQSDGKDTQFQIFEEYLEKDKELKLYEKRDEEQSVVSNSDNAETCNIKELPEGNIPVIPFEQANLRAIAFYMRRATRMIVLISTDLKEGDFGLDRDISFILDEQLYSVLKNLKVKVRGLDKALYNIEEKMKKAKRKIEPIYCED